ncbi:hypothetical protein [Rothia mucilaginosa]
MATGFGIPNDMVGNGTTPEDIQTITAAEYPEAGVISGCEVTGTSTMKYKVAGGAVVIHLSPGRAVRVPVLAQELTTQPAPATGTRTEYVYVKQNTLQDGGNIHATVGIGSSVPSNAVMLSKREIRAGMTSTSAAPEAGNIVYSRPVGGLLGLLHHSWYVDRAAVNRGEYRRGEGTFYVPTDRNIDIRLSSSVSNAVGGGNNASARREDVGSVTYEIWLDDKKILSRERGYSNVFDTEDFARIWTVKAGVHRIYYKVRHQWGHPWWMVRDNAAGDQLAVVDMGVAKE